MNESIRSFIAIKINQEAHQAIVDAQLSLKKADAHVKWVAKENIHLTLSFLGSISLDQINDLKEALNLTLQKIQIITTNLTGLSEFRQQRQPRVIWIGLNDEKNKIESLADLIHTTFKKIGSAQGNIHTFRPHVTIGRVKSTKNIKQLVRVINEYPFPNKVQVWLDHVTLFKSTLTTNGPIYEALRTWPLESVK